jgi:hypothetical protein
MSLSKDKAGASPGFSLLLELDLPAKDTLSSFSVVDLWTLRFYPKLSAIHTKPIVILTKAAFTTDHARSGLYLQMAHFA